MVRRRLNVQRLMQRLAEMHRTVECLKAEAGVDRRTIERLLSGQTQNAQYHTITRLAQFLGVAPRELLLFPDAEEPAPPPTASDPQPQVAVRLPATGHLVLGRSQELAWLDQAWSCDTINVISIVAWGGVGKSALVNHWLGTMAQRGWREVPRVFGWTFASQGILDRATSADDFFDAALRFFGDPTPHLGTPWDKGHRLAQLVRVQRTLLVLDGFETLQHPPGPQAGQITDPAMAVFLQDLALQNPGVCLLTTRLAVADIAAFQGTTAALLALACLPDEAGAAVLQHAGCLGSQAEQCAVSREYGGHALVLQLLGSYVRDACGGDLRRRHNVPLLEGWMEAGPSWSLMDSYERWFGPGPERALLRLLGLFDGPASADALAALRAAPEISELNDALLELSTPQWFAAIHRLRSAGLVAPVDPCTPGAVDTHPLIRAYYRHTLRTHFPAAWRAGHDRLFTFLQTSVVEVYPTTLEAMVPLYAAVAHGCDAGRIREALQVWRDRIRRGVQKFSLIHLGAFGLELATAAHAFTLPWTRVRPDLPVEEQYFLLDTAGECLSALGRVHEAMEPLQQALASAQQYEHWTAAIWTATKLSEVARAQGDLTASLRFAEQSTHYTRAPGVPRHVHILSQTFYGFALYWVGRSSEARAAFQEAERVQQCETPARPILYAVLGYMYSELLLDQLADQVRSLTPQHWQDTWNSLCLRLTQALAFAYEDGSPRDMGLQHTSMGRLYTLAVQHARGLELHATCAQERAAAHFAQAIACLRASHYHNYFPRALLGRAALLRVQGHFVAAQADVDAALVLTKSSMMHVYQADAYLEQTCLLLATGNLSQALSSLEVAKTLVSAMGYERRQSHIAMLEARLQALLPSYI